jgi:hypothetical protein
MLYSNSLNYSLYVPPLGKRIDDLLIAGDLRRFLEELRRLASLGSKSANALLAFFYAFGAFKDGDRPDLAEAHCIEGAKSGDPYSQYVLAWVCYKSGRQAEATNWMLKSSIEGQFLPAMVDVAVWMAAGKGFKSPDARAAFKTLWLAHKNGHAYAIAVMAQLLLRGRFGLFGRAVAVLSLPALLIWGAIANLLWPLSERTFAMSGLRPSLFRRPLDSEPMSRRWRDPQW